MIEILSPSALATVQDLGRDRRAALGRRHLRRDGSAGARCGNLLLGNDEGAAAIEVPVFPFQVRFASDRAFAVTGADCAATARRHAAAALVGAPSARRARCCRSACRRQATWRGEPRLSVRRRRRRRAGRARLAQHAAARRVRRATRAARCGRATRCRRLNRRGRIRTASAWSRRRWRCRFEVDGLPRSARAAGGRVRLTSPRPRTTPSGPEPGRSRRRATATATGWPATTSSPRRPMELRSHGIVPGVIQVPHGGQPIVQMRDAQPSGGYPKIGTVIEADLWRLGQAPIGSRDPLRRDELGRGAGGPRRRPAAGSTNARRLVDLHRGQRSRPMTKSARPRRSELCRVARGHRHRAASS